MATVAMPAQALRLPTARMRRLTQDLGEMHRADQSKMTSTKNLAMAMVISTGSAVQAMSDLVCTSNPVPKTCRGLRLPTGNGGDGGYANSGDAIAVSDG